MKKSIIGLLWGESTLKVMAILYDSVITAFLLQFGLKKYSNRFTLVCCFADTNVI